MDFRILCIIYGALFLGYSEQCTNTYNTNKCEYDVFCTDTVSSDLGWQRFQRNSYIPPPPSSGEAVENTCSDYISYNGYQIDRVNLIYKQTILQMGGLLESVPKINDRISYRYSSYPNREEGILPVVYSLDLSDNDYAITPVIKSMQNLVVLILSRNHLNTAVLSNRNELSSLTELDLSYNTISDIVANSYEHPYSRLKKINMSHNYLLKIPDAVFDKIDGLQTLDLSHNYIEGFSPFTFEGVKHLLHLNVSNNRLTDINSSLFRFSELKTLSLRGNRINDIKVGDFEKLNNLELLDLSSNSIKIIDPSVFQNMISLYSLDLSNNGINVTSKETFFNLNSLSSIDLSRNKLTSLPKDMFKAKNINNFSVSENFLEGSLSRGMFEGVNVTLLDLSFQQLTAIEDYAFIDMIKLNSLYINNNNILSLSIMCFKTLTSLQLLDLSNNKISSIDFDKTDLTNLQSLFLRNNRLSQVSHEHFQNLNSLEYLDLSENEISLLEPNSFKTLSNLMNLRVSGNPLSGTLETHTFDGLVSLPSLDISRNLFLAVKNSTFINMNELKELNMSHGKIKELQYNAFANTGYIETLDLSFNELENFLLNLTELVALNTLLLNNNLIKTISSTSLQGLSSLNKLNLAYNSLESFQNDSFTSLIDLRYLDISYNDKIQFTNKMLEKSENLDTLNLSGIKTDLHFVNINDTTISQVTISDAGIQNITALNLSVLSHLTTLTLSNNNVSKLEIGAFSGIGTLRTLDLSFNKISFIQPGVFKDNELIDTLNISHNSLSVIGYGIFRGLIYLNSLDMSYNYIKDLQNERFYEVKSLTQLIVDHNKIESVSAEEFAGTNLAKLSIGDNPLSCHFLVRLKKTGVSFEITAINTDEHSGDNIDGVTCNKDQESSSIKPPITPTDNNSAKNEIFVDLRNILYNISNIIQHKNTVQYRNDSYLENITNVIENITNVIYNITNVIEKSKTLNDEKLSRVIDVNNNTNILLSRILSLQEKSAATTTTATTTVSIGDNENRTVDVIPYINKIKQELEKTITLEKENVIKEIESKLSLIEYHTESVPTSNEKLVSSNVGTKSVFTEACVALILLILVGLVLYKFYKSRMFIRSRLSYSTRELPGAMENSNL